MGERWLRYCRMGMATIIVLAALAWARTAEAGSDYTVRPGDTLYRIAREHGLTVTALAEANNIVNPQRIYAGQVLVIPDGPENAVETEDAGQDEVEAPGEATTEHVVQVGETLAVIAVRYGTSPWAIQQANTLGNPNVIFPGQRLTIPLSEGAAIRVPAPVAQKRIVVDKSEQRAYVYEGEELRWTFVVSTGMPGSETWEGTFQVRSKIPNAYAYLWSLQMPYWLGFYHTGYLENGFHALPIMSNGAVLWDGYLGTPVSYGCVILSYADAQTLYEWAEIGTEVVVQP